MLKPCEAAVAAATSALSCPVELIGYQLWWTIMDDINLSETNDQWLFGSLFLLPIAAPHLM